MTSRRPANCRLMEERDEVKAEIGERERRLEELQSKVKTLEGLRDQLERKQAGLRRVA